MKKLLLFSISLLMSLVSGAYAYTSNPSDCELVSVGCVKDQFYVSNYGPWSPKYGVKGVKHLLSPIIRIVFCHFYHVDNSLNFIRQDTLTKNTI